MVDNEHAPLIDSFGSSTPICIASSPEFPGAAFIFAAGEPSSKFRSESCEGMRREKESPRKKSNAKRRECRSELL